MFLDTTFCIDVMREQHRGAEGPATARLRELGETPLLVSVFVLRASGGGEAVAASAA